MSDKVEFDVYETPDGIEYSLDDWGRTFLMSRSGEGMSPIEYRTFRGPFQHGETVQDYVLRPRLIQYIVRLQTRNRDKYWTERARILDVFRPNRQNVNEFLPGKLKKFLEDGTQRALDVYLEQGLDFKSDSNQWDDFGSTEAVRFVAYNPVYYNPAQSTLQFTLGALSNLVFPITFPIQFGGSIINGLTSITYLGTWVEYPVIVITGPIAAPTIDNLTTGETLSLAYNIPAGRVVTIDLTYGHKTIVDDLGTNLVGALSTSSDLATWHIAPDPEAPGGVNQIQVMGSGATPGVTNITLLYFDRYVGL
jgi:hypothetical protein